MTAQEVDIMTVTIYSTSDDNRVVNKTLTFIIQGLRVYPTGEVSLHDPVFVIDYNAAVLAGNYLYCDTLSRYYYIRDIDIDTAQRMRLHCTIDPLYTYRQYIPELTATVVRSESIGAPTDIPDTQLPINPVEYDTLSQVFPTGGNVAVLGANEWYVLITIGGGTNAS